MTTRYKRKFEVPNLDAMSFIDLNEFWDSMNESEDEIVRITARYAKSKGAAMRARLSGDIIAASMHERECDRLYEMLPKSARW